MTMKMMLFLHMDQVGFHNSIECRDAEPCMVLCRTVKSSTCNDNDLHYGIGIGFIHRQPRIGRALHPRKQCRRD